MSSPDPIPPSPTPSPAKSRWARVGGAVRRASSVLVPIRPATPSSDKDDAASIKGSIRSGSFSGLDTSSSGLAPPKPTNDVSTPSPIAESPARELAATQDAAPVGPSPLSQPPDAEASNEPNTEPAAVAVSPQDYVPPPLIDSTAVGPGGFTDEPDELPQSEPILDPYAEHSRAHSVHTPEPVIAKDEQDKEPDLVAEQKHTEPEPAIPTAPNTSKPPTPAPTTPPAIDDERGSYFDVPARQDVAKDDDETRSLKSGQAAEQHDRSGVFQQDNESIHSHEDVAFPITPNRSQADLSSTIVAPEPKAIPSPTFDLDSGEHVWRGYDADPTSSRSVPNGNASARSRSPSLRPAYDDPFSDPIAPRIAVMAPDYPSSMPNPHPDPLDVSYGEHSYNVDASPQYSPAVVAMPGPSYDHVPARSIPHSPVDMPQPDTDERQPLLANAPSKGSYLFPVNTATGTAVQVSPQSAPHHENAAWASGLQSPRLHSLGWIEYYLPDGTTYYVHPTRRVVTDINLREHKWIDTVTDHIDHFRDGSHTSAGTELWLQASEITKRGFLPPRFWVDHKSRTVTTDSSMENGHANHKHKKSKPDDQLDIEYRYWAFMESHPAHTALPTNARAEAMDALTWSWTDRLLPATRTIPAPFSQDECQELMNLLRSFGSEQGETGLQTVVHTRIVSRILLRVAHWRQQYFRPNKPLPSDVGTPAPVKYRRPFYRALLDIVVGCLCLGIPYLLFDRHRQSRIDQESGYRNATPMAVIGACTCLIAAIVLSATITFLSLPGLDSFSRIAGFIAILFSTFSMASTVVAVFRYKADLEHPVSHVGVEGLMLLSRRSFVLSLPLVFLAYSIIAIIVGIILYSFRGVVTNPILTQEPFQEYTRWTVVGVFGGLAGMLTTSVLLVGYSN